MTVPPVPPDPNNSASRTSPVLLSDGDNPPGRTISDTEKQHQSQHQSVTNINMTSSPTMFSPIDRATLTGTAPRVKRKPISKVLIASNGLAAVKAMRSMRRWEAMTRAGEEQSQQNKQNIPGLAGLKMTPQLTFIALASSEDIAANAQFLQTVDNFVEVPGGRNVNNYANVDLICDIARREKVDAVWPGWGHASENPKLPARLAEMGIEFLGPSSRVMQLLGDKIYANVMAQTARVPCIPWSGDGLVSSDPGNFLDLDALFKKACCESAEDAVREADRIGYPVMLKASEGGGGKGIRKCGDAESVRKNFELCQMEVVGSPIFIMKYSSGSCHLEVQLLGDKHGNVCALSGRDCSSQRRFQKIFEEGPPSVADPDVFHEMQLSAMRLAQQVGYTGAGTVEFLYNRHSKEYYFLELNPRLQVEHPVTECITGVNIPAAQLQIGAGCSLHEIADIRRYFLRGLEDTGMNIVGDVSKPLDFSRKVPVRNHCIAARITAENPEDGFMPNSGTITKVDFAPTHESVWGYFSVATPGAVHEFADSQFGHLFAVAPTREDARRYLILSLSQLNIEGDIRTTVGVLGKLLKHPRFVENSVDTAWLDGLIESKAVVRMLREEAGVDDDVMSVQSFGRSSYQGRGVTPGGAGSGGVGNTMDLDLLTACDPMVIYAAVIRAHDAGRNAKMEVMESLVKGQVFQSAFPPVNIHQEIPIVWSGIQYNFKVTRFSETDYCVTCIDDFSSAVVRIKEHQDSIFMKLLSPGATGALDHLSASGSSSNYVKLAPVIESTGLRMKVLRGAGTAHEIFIPDVTDPSEVRADVQGKLVRFLVNEGDQVEEEQVICELEAMKMIVPVKSRSSGVVKSLEKAANSVVSTGDLLLRLDLSANKKNGSSGGGEGELRKWSEVGKERKALLFSVGVGGNLTGCEEKSVKQSSTAALRGYPRVGQLRTPSSLDQAAALLWDFLEFEAPFIPEDLTKPAPTNEAALQKLLKNVGKASVATGGRGSSVSASLFGGLDEEQLNQVYNVFACRSAFKARLSAALSVVKTFGKELTVEKPELVRALSQLPEEYGELVLLCSRFASEGEANREGAKMLEEGEKWLVGKQQQVQQVQQIGRRTGSDGSSVGSEVPSVSTLLKLVRAAKNGKKQIALEELVSQFYRGFDSLRVSGCSGHNSSSGFNNEKAPSSILAAAARWEFMFHHQGLSGYGVPNKRVGLAISISSIEKLKDVLMSGECESLVSGTVGGQPKHLQDSMIANLFRGGSAGSASGQSGRTTPGGLALPPLAGANDTLNVGAGAAKPLDELFIVIDESGSASADDVRLIADSLNSQAAAALFNTFDVRHITVVFAPSQEGGQTRLLHFTPSATLEVVDGQQHPHGTGSFASSPGETPDASPIMKATTSIPLGTGSFFSESGAGNLNGSISNKPFVISHRIYEEDLLLRDRIPTYAHLIQLTPQLRENSERIGPEQSNDALVLLKKDALHVRAVSYLETAKSKVPQRADEIDDPLAALFPSVLAAPAHEDDEDFHVLLEGALRQALEELARVRLDPRTASKRDAAKISLKLVARAAVGPRTLFANYKSIVLAALSGPVLQRLLRYRVDSVEFRFRLAGGENVRLEASSHGGEYLQPSAYLDQLNPLTGEVERSMDLAKILQGAGVIGGVLGGVLGAGGESEIENALQFEKAAADLAKKRTAAHRAGSTYVYDFPHLFRISLLRDLAKNGQKDAFVATELIFQDNKLEGLGFSMANDSNSNAANSSSNAALSLHGKILGSSGLQTALNNAKLSPVQRPIGHNTVGMVIWLCTFKTRQYPEGRCMLLIANDITHQAGSFGVKEDDLYARASRVARELGIPRIYISANSGARVGLVPKLEEKLQPLFTYAAGSDENDKTRMPTGFEYWYIEGEENLAAVKDMVEVEPIVDGSGAKRFKVTAVVGGSGIGVENLKGSALIAGETSRAYQETFTLSFVTGRSVGIGAYVNRLGQRVIQQRQGPMILTGFSALNKLLGREVYTSQDQLGGPQIMCPNGVTHLLVESDQEGVEKILEWLSFVPSRQGEKPVPLMLGSGDGASPGVGSVALSSTGLGSASLAGAANTTLSDDPITRPVTFKPTADAPYDVRAMLDSQCATQTQNSSDSPSGFFDHGSFTEVFVEWGRTVIAGRARLGGFPVGVIAVETNSVSRVVPADPANTTSQVVEEAQAGQVWFPDSAYKTAQCIRDFEKEGLPLMVFANWRGFSGGTRDMFSEILKFGAQIVDALVDYTFPVGVIFDQGGIVF